MKLSRPMLAAIALNELRGLCVVIATLLAMHHAAHAQNAPLTGLQSRGAVQGTDIIPIMPAGGTQLEQTTVLSLASVLGGSGGGLISSIALTVPTYSCAASGAGSVTITCTVTNESANTVYAGPASGSAAAPGFRALVAADIPAIGCSSLPALTGDVTTPGASCATTLAASGVTAGNYGSAFAVPVLALDAKGRATAASTAAIQAATGAPIGTGGTLYVATTGSDSNACTASGAPCLTIAHALSLIPAVSDGAVYTVNVADGTYAEGLCLEYTGAAGSWPPPYPALNIVGDLTTPANVILTGTCAHEPRSSGSTTASMEMIGDGSATVEGVTFNPSTAASFGLDAYGHNQLFLDGVTFENDGVGVYVSHGSYVALAGNITVSGFTNVGVWASSYGDIATAGSATISVTTTSAANTCFDADQNADMQFNTATDVGFVWTGSVTCPGNVGSVVNFAFANAASVIEFNGFNVTAQNGSTPAGSTLVLVYRLAFIAFDMTGVTLTAKDFTYQCNATNAGDMNASGGSGTRSFTSVGGNAAITGYGQCNLY